MTQFRSMRIIAVTRRSTWIDSGRALGRAASVSVLAGAVACMPDNPGAGYVGADTQPESSAPRRQSAMDWGVAPLEYNPGAEGVDMAEPTDLERPLAGSAAPDSVRAAAAREAGDAGTAAPEADGEPAIPVVCGADESAGPNGHCYTIVDALVTWAAARAACQSRGVAWDLASVRSQADSNFLQGLIADEAWLGGTDAATEATWTWVNDGVAFWQGEGLAGQALNGSFVNWFEDEPNGDATSDCLRMLADAHWGDLECSDLRAAVCEGPGQEDAPSSS
jgi:Lectin C-type domain